ncbi:sigma-E factor regulatory protein RseB domain-containing protein [Ammonicoccus fulvus]|uniref:Sigma-E factor regulatory protein RseB domain-containing protein n=1 Tax=Ammonicoccus fulvus TaxID=3138240 RepID=A0ABZ3FTF7_9ACTN
MSACPSRRRELAEMVDGALGLRELERLNAHLVDCAGCRAEADSLRTVRDRVRGVNSEAPASDLTDRLLKIAGERADQPLWARPFDRGRAGALPSHRRRKRHAVAGVMTMTCLLLAGLVGVGWAAAPPTRTPALDPGPVARSEFAAVQGETALANPAVIAARAAEATETKTGDADVPLGPEGSFSTEGARDWLQRAEAARLTVPHAGLQTVQIRHLAGFWVTGVEVEATPGRSTRVAFPDRTGVTRSALVPAEETSGIDRLLADHRMLVAPGPRVAGRDTVVVEARAGDRATARWWVDRETALILWQQTVDVSGATTLSAGYRSVSVGPSADPTHLPPRLVIRPSTANLTLASVGVLQGQGWQCADRLAGLDLARVRSDRTDTMVHTVYGDGIVTLSVLQQKGALTGPPDGFVWDPGMRAYRSLGITTMYAWQSGDTVFTVVTDGPAHLADRAVAELPHESPVLRTRVDRVVDGWLHLIGVAG